MGRSMENAGLKLRNVGCAFQAIEIVLPHPIGCVHVHEVCPRRSRRARRARLARLFEQGVASQVVVEHVYKGLYLGAVAGIDTNHADIHAGHLGVERAA